MTNPSEIQRFTRAERWLHRSIAVLMIILIGTAAALYIPDISVLVGNRPIMRSVHIIAGVVLPIPIVLALLAASFRTDTRELNHFTSDDWDWLKSPSQNRGAVGKFNAGQKLNASFTLGAVIVMFLTGMIMWLNGPFPDDIRTGATFVHDWLTLLIVIVLLGHLWMAMGDREARRGMRTGNVSTAWAQHTHPKWAKESATPRSALTEPEG
jgi:formate dehydrogenase subunit gamma